MFYGVYIYFFLIQGRLDMNNMIYIYHKRQIMNNVFHYNTKETIIFTLLIPYILNYSTTSII